MEKVYFKPIDSYLKTDEINKGVYELLETIVEKEDIKLENFIPLKVHFGEKGNTTYIKPDNFKGIVNFLADRSIESAYTETNVLYKGERTTSENHIKLAREHGFTDLPIVIADGDHGENYKEVEINRKHFTHCKIGGEIANKEQIIVISHFKGHMLAGFGGAIKQLGMGCAARGGKLAQHSNSIPKVNTLKCKGCKMCYNNCPENAIIMTKKAKINKDKCVGCASCMTVCPFSAISNNWLASISKSFNERLAEYAYAAHKDKRNIYITFAFNITKKCDCDGHPMKTIAKDIGIFASKDPVAIDKACLDVLDKNEGRTVFKKGRYTLDYAESIGLGSTKYELIQL